MKERGGPTGETRVSVQVDEPCNALGRFLRVNQILRTTKSDQQNGVRDKWSRLTTRVSKWWKAWEIVHTPRDQSVLVRVGRNEKAERFLMHFTRKESQYHRLGNH